MRSNPRRALVGLAMAGSIIIMPPAVGYAVGLSHGATGQHVQAIQHGGSEVSRRNDNDGTDDRRRHVDDNADNVDAAPVANDNDGVNDNVSANDPGAYSPPPIMPPSGYNAVPGQDDGGNNSPNNSDSPGNGGNP